MAIRIVSNDLKLEKCFSSKIKIPCEKKEFSIMKLKTVIRDAISAKERLSIPPHYKWLKFKTYFLCIKGIVRG